MDEWLLGNQKRDERDFPEMHGYQLYRMGFLAQVIITIEVAPVAP